MVCNKQVVVESGKEGRYRRKVGKVQLDGTEVNRIFPVTRAN